MLFTIGNVGVVVFPQSGLSSYSRAYLFPSCEVGGRDGATLADSTQHVLTCARFNFL